MSDELTVTPELADVLARWAGVANSLPAETLAEILDGVRQVVDRLYAVDVQDFEADYVQPDTRAR